jgi:alpha-1,2-mannosyltransferase
MKKFISSLREGSWLTRSRLRAYPAIVLAVFAGVLVCLWSGAQPWSGADFVGFWVPANLAAEGHSAAIYDPALLQQLQESVSGARGYLPWPYPPIYLLLILPLGLLPYWYAFVIWEGAGLAVYWLAVRQVVGRDGILLAIAFPAVWIAIINGHAEHMLAGLLGAALLRLDDRPFFAGTLIGFCAVKPHLFLLVPVASSLVRNGGPLRPHASLSRHSRLYLSRAWDRNPGAPSSAKWRDSAVG